MFYVGIDVASQKHDCCVLDERGRIRDEFQISNTQEGFSCLLRKLTELSTPLETKIGLEATGIYDSNLTAFLRRKGFEVMTFNPLQIKKRLSATTLRKTKTDRSDARFLAITVMQGAFQPDTPVSYHISELKSLSRLRFQLVKERSKVKTQVKAALHILFPEFESAFSDIFGAAATAVLTAYPSARQIMNCELDSLAKLLKKASRGRLGLDKAAELKQLAANSIGIASKAKETALQCYLEQIQLLNKQVDLLEREIKALMEHIDSPILSVPGISYTLGATILSELGDIHRFSSPAKLLAFAGLDPSVYQSGKYAPSSGTMVKRGSPYLRWALIQAARLVPRFDPTFGQYLRKKLSEGKHFSVASSHVAKKLVRVIFALLTKNVSFSPNILASAA